MTSKSCVVISLLLAALLAPTQSRKFPRNADCIAARCNTLDEINKLWCHRDPTYYCVCRPETESSWALEAMPCAPETLFSFVHQKCVSHLEEQDREACYYADTPGDGSGSGSGSGDDGPWLLGEEASFSEQRFEGTLDDLVEDDVVEFLFPGRV